MVSKKSEKFSSKLFIALIVLLFGLSFAASTAFGEAKVSGYVKLDWLINLDNDDRGQDFSAMPPRDGTAAAETDGGMHMHARQSRVRFTSATDSDMGKVTTFFEGDFFGAAGNSIISNSDNLRKRHAWLGVGNLNAGQFWTLQMAGLEWAPETLDFAGPAGIPFIRQAGIRYTIPMGNNKLQIALENGNRDGAVADPGAAGGLIGGAAIAQPTLPDILAHFQLGLGGGTKIGFNVVNHNVRLVNTAVPGSGGQSLDEEASGLGTAVYGNIGIGGKNNVKFYAGFGQLGRYSLMNVVMGGGDAFIKADAANPNGGTLEIQDVNDLTVSAAFWLGAKNRINLAYGNTTINWETPFDNAGLPETWTTLHANFISSITKTTKVGVEFMTKTVEWNAPITGAGATLSTTPTSEGSGSRVQISAQTTF